jgi:biotin carboxyl carrier protein
MTTFEVEVNGRGRTVSVDRTAPGRFLVRVAGRSLDVEAVRVGSFGLSLLLGGPTSASREVQIVPTSARGELLVGMEGRTAAAAVDGRRTGRPGTDGGAHAAGEQKVVAPMPGRVVRVLVTAGDEVSAKQAVVVVEAMKMENELRSPKAGRVKDVSVVPGTSVEAGRVLIVIE